MQTQDKQQKGYKGMAMEGMMARWYAKIRSSGSQIEDWRKQAAQLTSGLPDGAEVLEVAPGATCWRNGSDPGHVERGF